MKILFAILFNALILWLIAYYMPYDIETETWVLTSWDSFSNNWWKIFFIWGIVLGFLNTIVKPVLKIISFPFMMITMWLFTIVINWIILWLFQEILLRFNMSWVQYEIKWVIEFIIAVAIFSVLNTIYNILFK